jgi:hypothetical protein
MAPEPRVFRPPFHQHYDLLIHLDLTLGIIAAVEFFVCHSRVPGLDADECPH